MDKVKKGVDNFNKNTGRRQLTGGEAYKLRSSDPKKFKKLMKRRADHLHYKRTGGLFGGGLFE